jgi:class 3 adenylate cyclase/tetratricopeptide (TPR) repeat protein
MNCLSCQAENPDAAAFCGQCGARLSAACPGCGVRNPPTNKFCHACGTGLAGATPAAAPPPPSPAVPQKFARPETYTPKHLADKILTSKDSVQGERKVVTVMFVDVCGFTSISESLDPEDVHGIMDRAFEVMLEAVHRYEGTINQFLGDGVMALFGAPIAHEDHPQRALCAALAIRERLRPLQEDVRRTHGVDFQVRMGINTGVVVVGAIGRDLRMDYTAVGDTTNLAARLMSLAQPGQIVVSRQTQHLRERFFSWDDLGNFQVKGKTEPVHAFELLSEIRGRTRLEVSKERGLTPLIGRERELADLVNAFRRAGEGHGGTVLIAGEPGVGKSRLLYEFLRSIETAGGLELETSCVAYGGAIPYRPILELVRGYLGLLEEMRAEEVRWRAEKGLVGLGIEDEEAATLLAHFLGVPAPGAFINRLAAAQLKERTFAVVRDLFLRASESAPLVVVVENIQWIDRSSEEFLAFLAAELPRHRLVLLLTTRPGTATSVLAGRAQTTVVLEGLEGNEIRRMVASLARADQVSGDLFALMIEKSGGNPLYVEEILRQLRETDGLSVVDGELRLRTGSVTVPGTIHDIIAARIDRVSEDLKHVLQGAAVIGRRFGISLLSRVLGVPGDVLSRRLVELHRSDFIFPATEDPELMYSFKHALTQDVVYGSVLERRRREYHNAAAVGLEALYPEDRTVVVELIAYHFQRAQVWDKAATYLRQAAVKAQARSAHREALASLEAALEALHHLPETPQTREQEIDVRIELRGSLYPLGEFDRMVMYLREAESMATAISDARRLGLVSIHTAEYCRQTGRFAEARSLAEQALAQGDKLQDVPLRLYASHYLGLACHALGDYRRAAEVLRAVVHAPEPEWPTGAFGGMVIGSWAAFQAITLAWLARCLTEMGEFEEALDAGTRALAVAEDVGSPYSLTVACLGLGYSSLGKGDLDAATRVLERAHSLAREARLALLRPQAARLLGSAYLSAGRVEEGLALVRAAAEEVESRRLMMQQASVLALLGEAWLFADHVDEASAAARRALAVAEERGQRGDAATALFVLGEAAARDPDSADTAEEHYRRAIELAHELSMRPLLARAHLGIGHLYLRADVKDRAAGHLRTAARLFSAMEMRERDRVEALLRSHGLAILRPE